MIDVLVCDDSALVRALLREIIDAQPDMRTVGVASDPFIARDLIKSLNPHVLTLDVEMPKMNGLDFLEKLMRLRPMPVVMVSTLTERGSSATLRALELGAIDFVAKPAVGIDAGVRGLAAEIVEKVRTAAASRVRPLLAARVDDKYTGNPMPVKKNPRLRVDSTERIMFLGASTGGCEALAHVLVRLPPDAPGVMITQHMPPVFTRTFAERLDKLCKVRVKEAEDGERVMPGSAYIAPGDRHLLVNRAGSNYVCSLSDAPPVGRHRPSVDVLFRSAARIVGPHAVAAILTGMGSDGAEGLRELHEAGAATFAQDEASCVVFGMPKVAIGLGAVDVVAPVESIAGLMMEKVDAMGRNRIRV